MSIPLTFDWLTVLWFKVRLHWWWKTAGVSPRKLLLALLLGAVSGCVPITRLEEAQSAAQVEKEGWRRSEQELQELKAENLRLSGQIQAQGRVLEERDEALSQAELDRSVQGKQRQDAEGVVEQLRSELARVGSHLQSYRDDKQKLEAELEGEAERARELARLARDAALAFSAPVTTGEYGLDAAQDRVVLRVPREQLIASDGGVKPEALATLKLVARVLKLHPRSKLSVEDGAATPDPAVVGRLVEALGAQGALSDRIEAPRARDPGAEKAAAGPDVDVSFGFSVP